MLLFLSISLWPAYCAAALIPASVLQRPQYGNDLKASDLPLSNTSVFANNRSSSLGGIGGVLKIACNSDMYGKNLKVKSCQRLFGYISKDTRQYTFADRESRVPFDIALPMRTYSGKFADRMLHVVGGTADCDDGMQMMVFASYSQSWIRMRQQAMRAWKRLAGQHGRW